MDTPPNTENSSPELCFSEVRVKLEDKFTNVQELSKAEGMHVYVRIRPMLNSEVEAGYKECIRKIDDQVVRAVVPASSVKYKMSSHISQDIIQDFTFTTAFGPETGQFEFFEQCMMSTMQNFIEGQNSLVFSYGTTGSGKTFTLQGNPDNPGIVPLSLHLFFASVEDQLLDKILVKPDKFADVMILNDNEIKKELELKDQLLSSCEQEEWSSRHSSAKKSFAMILCDTFSEKFEGERRQTTLGVEEMVQAQSASVMKEMTKASADLQTGYCSIWVSFVEIYNEYVYDLLTPFANQRVKLNLGEDKNGDVYVKGLREVSVSNSYEALKLLNYGQRNLRIASTKLNYQSSRSHCIFTIKVIRIPDPDNITHAKVNRLSFCDLAGSERAAKSQTVGLRLKEAGCINTSLLVLGRCLEQLRLKPSLRDKKLIPFRESKLTRLFSGFFTGRGKAVMISNASPSELTFDETLHVLRFSAVAKELIINDSYIATASSTLQSITNLWANAKNSVTDASNSTDRSISFEDSIDEVIQEKDELIEKLLDLAESLKNNLEQEKREKAELEIKMRQDICEEYSKYSDELLENQKRTFEGEREAIREIYQKRIAAMEKMYENIIKDYKMQLDEESGSSDDETNSVDEIKKYELEKRTSFGFKKSVNEVEIIKSKEPTNDDSSSTKDELMKTVDYTVSLETELETLRTKLEVTSLELQSAIKEKNDLLEELSIYKTDNLSVKKDKDCLMMEITAYEEDIKSLKEDLAILSSEKDTISEKLEETEDKFSSQSEEIANLMKRINDLLEEQEKSSANHESSLNEAKNRADEANAKLNNVIQKLQKEKENVCELQANIKTLESKIAELQSIEQSSLQSKNDYEACLKEIAKLQEENSSLKEKLANADRDASVYSHTVAKLKEVVERLKESNLENKENHSEIVEKYQNEAKETEEVVKSIKKHLEKAIMMSEEQTNKINLLETECSSLREEITSLQCMRKDLESKLESAAEQHGVDEANAKLIATDQELQMEKEKVSKLQANIKILESKISELQGFEQSSLQSKSDYEACLIEIEKFKGENSLLKEKLVDAESSASSYSQSIAELKKEVNRLKESNLKNEEKHNEIVEKYQTEAKESEEVVKSMEKQLEKATKMSEEQTIKFNALETECSSLRKEITNLQCIRKDLESKLESTAEHNGADEANGKLNGTIQELQIEKEKVSKLQADIRTLESKIAELQGIAQSSLQSKNAYEACLKEIAELQEQISSLKEKLKDAESTASAYSHSYTEHKVQFERLKVSNLENEEKLNEIVEKYQTESALLYKMVDILQKCEAKATSRIEALLTMVDILQKCETNATSKSKAFHTNSIQKVEQIMDLKTIVKTKERELENLNNDYNTLQKQLKDAETSSKKLLQTEKQKNLSVIEDMKKKQSAVQKENETLKNNLTKLQREINQLQKEIEENKNELQTEKQKNSAVIEDMLKKQSSLLKENETLKNNLAKEENSVKENTPENNVSKKSKNIRQRSNKRKKEKPEDSVEEKEQKSVIYEEKENSVKENTPENNISKKSKNIRQKSSKRKTEKPEDTDEEKGQKTVIYEESDENKCNENIKKEKTCGRKQLRCMENMVTDMNSNQDKNKCSMKDEILKRKNNNVEEKPFEKQTVKKLKFSDMNGTENMVKLQNLRVQVLKANIAVNDIPAPSPRMTRGRKRLVMAKENTASKASPRTVRS